MSRTNVLDNGRIIYVEPNYTYSADTVYDTNGLNVYEATPPTEDYCIYANLVVEMKGRKIVVSTSNAAKEKASMTFTSTTGGTTVNFMQGVTMPGTGEHYFTTDYTEPFLGDIKKNGPSTEMFGIKSIDISYNNYMMPQVNIEFVDVRGVALFAQKQAYEDNLASSDRALTADGDEIEVANTFFQAFFTVPYPKFTLYVKGFYGQPVAYQLLCSDFRAKFESSSGNFNCTVNFIGYHFAFLNDVMMNAIIAAPYSDYVGSEYWDSKNFQITDENGGKVNMPKMAHVVKAMKTAKEQADKLAASAPEVQEKNELDEKNTKLNEVRESYAQYVGQVTAAVTQASPDKLPKEENDVKWYVSENDKNGNWKSAVIYTESGNTESYGKYFDRKSIETSYEQFKEKIEAYNNEHGDATLPVPPNFSDATPTERIESKENNGKYTIKESTNDDIKTKNPNLYELFRENTNNGNANTSVNPLGAYSKVYYYTDNGFSDQIEQYLEKNDKETEEKNKEITQLTNNLIAASLGWIPSVENLTRIIMAHFETLAWMLYKCGEDIVNEHRTIQSLGISPDDITDVKPEYEVVPPFPLVTESKTVYGAERRQDSWVGKYQGYFKEKDLVNGILNGVWEVSKELAEPTSGDTGDIGGISDAPMKSMVKIPLTPYDLVTKVPIYERSNEDMNEVSSLLGLVGIRGLAIFGLNEIEGLDSNAKDVGKAEAINLMTDHNISKDMKDKLGGLSGKTDEIWQMMLGKESESIKKPGDGQKPWPWRKATDGGITDDNGNMIICKDNSKDSFVMPITNLSWKNIWSGIDGGNNPVAHQSTDFIDTNAPTNISSPKQNKFTIEMNMNRAKTIIDNQVTGVDGLATYKKKIAEQAGTDNYSKYLENPENYIAYIIENADNIDYSNPIENCCLIPTSSSFCKNDFKYFSEDGWFTDYGYNLDNLRKHTPSDDWKYKDGSVVKRKGENAVDEYLKVFNSNEFTLVEFPGVNEDADPTIDNSIFGNPYYYKQDNIHCKAMLFLCGLGKFIKYGEIIDDLKDREKTILNVPLPAVVYAGGLCWAKDNYTKFRDSSIRSKIREKSNIIDGFEYDVKKNLEKVFTTWVNGGIDWADSIQIKPFVSYASSLEIQNLRNFGGELQDKEPWLEGEYGGKLMNFLKSSDGPGENFFRNYITIDEDLKDEGIRLGNRDGGPGVVPAVSFALAGCTFIKHTKFVSEGTHNITVSSDIMKSYFEGFLEKVLENYTVGQETTESSAAQGAVDSKGSNDDIRVGVYRYCKLMYDKWIGGITEQEFNDNYSVDAFFDRDDDKYFVFIDTYYLKANNVPMNIQHFVDEVMRCYSNDQYSLMSFLSEQYSHNKFSFNCISNFTDLSSQDGIQKMFELVPYVSTNWNVSEHPNFVVMYCDQPSSHLELPNSEYPDDSFLASSRDRTKWPTPLTHETAAGYKIPAFGVTYGMQYQSYFTDISVSMDNPMVTEQSIKAQFQIATAAASESQNSGDRTTMVYYGQDLYSVYSNNSYTCEVTMLGCAYIQPLMYFCLNNVPMFKGTYLVQRAQHMITPGNMTTKFWGTRMANTSTRWVEDYGIRRDANDNGNGGDNGQSVSIENKLAGIDNDCPYKVYPLNGGGAEGCLAELVPKIKKHEGGWSDNPNDKGGPTNNGVTLKTYRAVFGSSKTKEDLKNITDEEWMKVLKDTCWDDWRADEINNCSIVHLLVDWHWASGAYGIYYPQEVLGLKRSYKVNDATINAINSYPNQRELFQKFWNRRKKHFEDIVAHDSSQRTFLKGWLIRLNDYQYSENGNNVKVANNNDNHIDPCVTGLVNAVNKTSQSSSVMVTVGIDSSKSNGNVGYLTNADRKSDFGLIFDILLNAYSDKLDEIKWVTTESSQVPTAFICTVNEASKSTKISVVKPSGENIQVSFNDGCMHEHFCKAIVKKYRASSGSVANDIVKVETSTIEHLFEKYAIKDCSTALNEAGLSSYSSPLTPNGGPANRAECLKALGITNPNPSKSVAASWMTTVKIETVDGTITTVVHKKLASDVQAIFKEIKATGFKVILANGFQYRYAQSPNGKSKGVLSMHAYGAAIDVNGTNKDKRLSSNLNPYIGGARPQTSGDSNTAIRTYNSPVVKIFAKHGWGWGGSYGDFMHFSFRKDGR